MFTPRSCILSCLAALLLITQGQAADLDRVKKVDLQPLAAQASRVVEALNRLGAPLPAADRKGRWPPCC